MEGLGHAARSWCIKCPPYPYVHQSALRIETPEGRHVHCAPVSNVPSDRASANDLGWFTRFLLEKARSSRVASVKPTFALYSPAHFR